MERPVESDVRLAELFQGQIVWLIMTLAYPVSPVAQRSKPRSRSMWSGNGAEIREIAFVNLHFHFRPKDAESFARLSARGIPVIGNTTTKEEGGNGVGIYLPSASSDSTLTAS